jgi:hypothetical protein
MLTATVVTSSTGREWLKETIDAIRNQTYPAKHFIFINGEGFHERAGGLLSRYADSMAEGRLKVAYLPGNGGNVRGIPGPEATYAAAPFLVEGDVIFYCNDDDVYEPDHVESLVKLIGSKNLDWAFSLRKAVALDGTFVAEDNCESLGAWPCVYSPQAYLVDCSSYAVTRDYAVRVAPAWYHTPIGDRIFLAALKAKARAYGCTGRSSVRYRLQPHGGVNAKFFAAGNATMAARYPAGFPWRRETVFRAQG